MLLFVLSLAKGKFMKPIIIGIDPDSDKHGVAIYQDGKLIALHNWQALDLFFFFQKNSNAEVHIENVCGNNAAFKKDFIKNQRSQAAISRSLGKCQQAQIEVERIAEHFNIKVLRHPISKNWKETKSGKRILKDHFGWNKSSNEDTRSAAYFGYLGVKSWRITNQK